jgi:hypothetical protein
MPTNLTLEWDRQAKHVLASLGAKAADKALYRAVAWGGRDALRSMASAAGKGVRARKALRLETVKAGLGTRNPRNGTPLGALVWTLTASAAPVALAKYPHKDTQHTTRKGVWVTVNKGARKQLRHAFEVRLKSGHVGIFVRGGDKRLPLKQLFSSAIKDPVGDIAPELLEKAQVIFSRTFARVVVSSLERTLK